MSDRRRHRCPSVLLTAAVVAFLTGMELRAQTLPLWSLVAGVDGGYQISTQSAQFPIYAGFPDCGEFLSGNGSGATVGLTMTRLWTPLFGASLRIGWSRSSGRFSVLPQDPQRIVVGGALVDVEREFRFGFDLQSVSMELLGTYHPATRLSLGLGGSIGYRFASKIDQTDNVLGPGNTSFEGGERARTMPAPYSQQRLALGAVAKVLYYSPAGPRLRIPLHVSLRADLRSPLEEFSWQSYGLEVGAGLEFDLSGRDVPESMVESSAVPSLQRYSLSASIDLYGVGEEGERLPVTRIRAFDVLYKQRTPLIGMVFFGRGSTSIPDRFVSGAGEPFALDSLAGSSALETNRRLLDIVGIRLRERPSARLQLIGCVSREESPVLGYGRTRSVRSYLVDRWGIDSSRISVGGDADPFDRSAEETEDGRAENRRVVLSSSDSSILAPVFAVRIVREYTPPIIQVDPSYHAEAGLKQWAITISQAGNVVARYSSQDEVGSDAAQFNWRIRREGADTSLAPVVAELTIEDSLGEITTARSHIPLILEQRLRVVDRNSEEVNEGERTEFLLIGFGYNSSELNRAHDGDIATITESVRTNDRISVIGYTDRIGDERHNVELSEQRGRRVADALRTALIRRGMKGETIDSHGVGIDRDRFDNDVPEGRILSRSVRVSVERNLSER